MVKRRSGRLRRLPRWFVGLMAGAALLVVALPFIRPATQTAAAIPDVAPPFVTGLSVSDVKLERDGPPRIAGWVDNANPEAYRKIRLTFSTWTAFHEKAGVLQVNVGAVPARGRTAFATDTLPPGVVRFYLEEIGGEAIR